MKQEIKANKRLLCYLICIIMILTGVSTTSFAESSTNDQEPVKQETNESSNVIDSEPSEDADKNRLLSVAEIYNIVVSIDGELGVKAAVDISWDFVEGADYYEVLLGEELKASEIIDDSFKFDIVNPKLKTYVITINAYNASSDSPIAAKSFNVDFATLSASNVTVELDDFKLTSGTSQKQSKSWSSPKIKDGYKIITLNPDVYVNWTKAKNATDYIVYKYIADSKGNINSKYSGVVVNGNYNNNQKYHYVEFVNDSVFSKANFGYYAVRVLAKSESVEEGVTIRASVLSDKAKYLSVDGRSYYYFKMNKFLDKTGKNYHGERASTIRTTKFHAKTNTKAKLYIKGSGNAGKGWLSKGVKGWTTGGSGSKFKFHMNSGKYGYVMRKKLSCYKVDYSPYVDWTKSAKEKYVNSSSKFKSSRGKVIWISRYSQTVNVFKKDKATGKWKLEYIAECTTGQFRNYTSSGVKKVHTRIKHRKRSIHHYYYLNCFSGLNSVHGPTYFNKNGALRSSPAAHLSYNASKGTLGCVRVWNTDAKWVWDHCGIGTKVVVY